MASGSLELKASDHRCTTALASSAGPAIATIGANKKSAAKTVRHKVVICFPREGPCGNLARNWRKTGESQIEILPSPHVRFTNRCPYAMCASMNRSMQLVIHYVATRLGGPVEDVLR